MGREPALGARQEDVHLYVVTNLLLIYCSTFYFETLSYSTSDHYQAAEIRMKYMRLNSKILTDL
jgi:hypothetical protein